ncbi:MAG: hypothetical protein JWM52_80 [Candidatus Saccharibacteria bacterium]|nr:hypothetical protein [Candidatus Saccharibacteria bacterium]
MRASNGELLPSTQPLVPLPPREFWLYDPFTEGRKVLEPDSRGFVDEATLIEAVMSSIDPAYQWMQHRNLHHLQWSNSRYESLPDAAVNPQKFRELPERKSMLPLDFHQWLHLLTELPDVPSEESMYFAIEARNAVIALGNVVHFSKKTASDYATSPAQRERVYWQMLNASMDTFGQRLDHALSLPSEFQLVDFGSMKFENTHDMIAITRKLALTSVIRTPDISSRIVFQEAA